MAYVAHDLADKLATQRLVVLDGGLATELERRGFHLRDHLWSASVLAARPDVVRDVHLAYLRAGVDVITTAAYQASVPGFVAAGHPRAAAEALYRSSVRVAFEAQQAWCRERGMRPDGRAAPLVAMSIGSYGAYLADGSEYRGMYGAPAAEVRAFHEERLALAVDELRQWTARPLIAFETVPSLAEAELLCELLAAYPDAQGWISFSCGSDRTTAEGQLLTECARSLGACEQLAAVGVNCTSPDDVAALVPALATGHKPVIAYPNGGGHYDAVQKTWVGDAAEAASEVVIASWIRSGARGLGGCCRTTPEWVARLVALRDASP